MIKAIVLAVTHLAMLAIGFMAGVYALPILVAAKGPDAATLQIATRSAIFKGRFDPKLKGSDLLHWGEGDVMLSRDSIVHAGRLSPGPDYKVYLTTEFVDSKDGFLRVKSRSKLIGDVRSFDGFALTVPQGVDVASFTTVVVWCEAFSMFISAANYQ